MAGEPETRTVQVGALAERWAAAAANAFRRASALAGSLMGRAVPMARRPAFAVAAIVLCNLLGWAQVTGTPLAEDHDTPDILKEIDKHWSAAGMLGWFTHDWPLRNHFYRPLVTLSLALDRAVFGDWARGYRISSWVLAVGMALLVYAWIALWTRRSELGLAAGIIFSLRQAGWLALSLEWGALAGAAYLVWAACERRRPAGDRRREWVLSGPLSAIPALVVVLGIEWQANVPIISWIATRTAILGGFFALACGAACAAFVRTGKSRYCGAMVLAGAAALASYEQSVTIVAFPLVLLLCSRGGELRRGWVSCVLLVSLVAAYVELRVCVIGVTLSGYQTLQAKTSGAGTVAEMSRYLVPPRYMLDEVLTRAGTGIWSLFDSMLWQFAAMMCIWVAAYWRMLRMAPREGIGLWLAKGLLFLPMSFLHVFMHYYYLPEAAAAGLGACLIWPGLLGSAGGSRDGAEAGRDACVPG